ncbi:MAG: CoA pyrophosphatase [Desulfuromonadales bacterium]|nr:MAG: CoA pyrophosphatase [Desulfuromonadales bacterium]
MAGATEGSRIGVHFRTFEDIALSLGCRLPEIIHTDGHKRASVAFVLRDGEAGMEVLFIERASRDGDPWSGDLGFPGGRVEDGDGDPRRTAERETLEELGLDLSSARCLGRLSDIVGAHLPVHVACFVYGVGEVQEFRLSDEVRDVFWVPLAELAAPERQVTAAVRFGGEDFERPAISLPVEGKPVLWGITYRLVMQFLKVLAGPSAVQKCTAG